MILELKGIYKDYQQGKMIVPVLKDVNFSMEEGEYVAIMGPSGCGKSTLLNILGLLDNPTGGEYYLNGTEVSRYTESQRPEIKDVSLNLNKRQILDHVSLKLQEGKIYGLVGNNGSGKTMLMKCVCGFIHPTSGMVLADGKVIGKDVDYLPDAGVIIETPGFISYYSGLQNLKVLAGIKNKIGNLQIRDAMKRVGLDPDLKLSVKKYSLGMRQRLGLAQAMMESPSVLILDEPMNGLDKNGVEEIRQLLLSMKNDHKTIVIASHNAEDIQVLCDEVYEMENGKLCNMNTV